MFEFLRALIPGRKATAVPASPKQGSAAKKALQSKTTEQPAGKVVTDRPAFGQKPKAVYKPPQHKKRRAKR